MAEWPPSPARPSLRDALLSPFPALRGPDWLEPGLSPTGEQQLREALLATPDRLGVARQAGMVSDEGLRNMAHMVIPGIGKKRSMGEFTPYEIRNAGKEPQEPTIGGVSMTEAGNYAMPAGPHVGMVKAYHGSPHDFERFDMSKIGTGEGAQVYGHGLYFAENPEVAQNYKDTLAAKKNVKVGGAELQNPGLLGGVERQAYYTLQHAGGDVDQALRNASAAMNADEVKAVLQRWKEAGVKKDPGKTYEVAIDAHPDEFLDWDKPLSEQPKPVQDVIAKLWDENNMGWQPDGTKRPVAPQMSLQAFYQNLGLAKGGYGREVGVPATEALRAAGIKGIRYADQGSRGNLGADAERLLKQYDGSREDALWAAKRQAKKADDALALSAGPEHRDNLTQKHHWEEIARQLERPATSNYVVFDDKIIDILKKYGIAGLTAGLGGIAALTGNLPREKTQGEQGGQLPVATLGIRG